MDNWLAKVSKILRKASDQSPVLFELPCPCGSSVGGERRNTYQRVLCRECGESFFILPVDVYPQQKVKRSSKEKKGTQRSSSLPVANPDDATATKTTKGAIPQDPRSTVEPVSQSTTNQLRRVFTPFRLVVISIVVLFSITGYWIIHRRAGEQAIVDLKNASRQAYEALEADDLLAAATHFQIAVDALDVTGRDDQQAREIRQMSRELVATTKLASVSLFKILEEAQEKWRTAGEDELELHIRLNFRGKWIVMETTIFQIVGPDGTSRKMIDFPLVVNGRPVMIDAPLRVLEGLTIGEQPKKIVFAAQIQNCQPSPQNTNQWVVHLQDETAFLWANLDNYHRLGFNLGDEQAERELQQLFDLQARIIGVVQ